MCEPTRNAVLAENYRIQRRAVEVAFDQVENSLDVSGSPSLPSRCGPAGQAAAGQQRAANAASLTQQLLFRPDLALAGAAVCTPFGSIT